MLTLAALALAAAPPPPTPTLDATAPWWDKITMTMDSDGKEKSCAYVSSVVPGNPKRCDVEDSARSPSKGFSGPDGIFAKLTLERRFSPGDRPDSGRLNPGDKLFGSQVLFLTIDAAGAVQDCRKLAAAGDAPPDYGCDDVKAERFLVKANAAREPLRQAFMTILVYGHTEQPA